MNKALLEYEMKRKHVSVLELSEHLGISRSSFWKKCNGTSEFKLSEIRGIISYLEISNPEPIFFADEVS